MDELLNFLLGLAVAFVASVPSGPVNLAVFRAALNGQRKASVLVAFGGAASEMFYCIIGVWGASYVPKDSMLSVALHTISVPILLALGISALRKQKKQVHDAVEGDQPPIIRKRSFLVGAGLNLLNPVLVPFWALVANHLIQHEWMSDRLWPLVTFVIGVFFGTLLLLYVVSEIAHAQRKTWSENSLLLVNRIIGFVFLAFAAYQGYKVVRIWMELNWLF